MAADGSSSCSPCRLSAGCGGLHHCCMLSAASHALCWARAWRVQQTAFHQSGLVHRSPWEAATLPQTIGVQQQVAAVLAAGSTTSSAFGQPDACGWKAR